MLTGLTGPRRLAAETDGGPGDSVGVLASCGMPAGRADRGEQVVTGDYVQCDLVQDLPVSRDVFAQRPRVVEEGGPERF